jgi:hypothetical protein
MALCVEFAIKVFGSWCTGRIVDRGRTKTCSPRQCTVFTSATVILLRRASIGWCVNGMPASAPMGTISDVPYYFAENNSRMGDFRLPSWWKWDLWSFGILRSVDSYLPTFRDNYRSLLQRSREDLSFRMGFFRTTLIYNILTVIVKNNHIFCWNLKGDLWKGSRWVPKTRDFKADLKIIWCWLGPMDGILWIR